MTPSERIKLIRSISSALAKEDWPLIDLTLKQFGLDIVHQWEGSDRAAYVIDMISDGDDHKLLDLGKHLGVESELAQVSAPSFWKPQEPCLFISHITAFKTEAMMYRNYLSVFGINGFVAHQDIEPTKEWQNEIEVALLTMDALLVLLSPGFNESMWTDQEVGVAVGRRIPVIPVRIGIDPYGFIGKYQAVQGLSRTVPDVCEEIVILLLKKPGIESKLTEALVRKLASSDSWAAAKKNMDYLERCQHLRPEMVKVLQKAIEENSQVRDSWNVPDRINALIKKIGS
jgi:hypothetical protein